MTLTQHCKSTILQNNNIIINKKKQNVVLWAGIWRFCDQLDRVFLCCLYKLSVRLYRIKRLEWKGKVVCVYPRVHGCAWVCMRLRKNFGKIRSLHLALTWADGNCAMNVIRKCADTDKRNQEIWGQGGENWRPNRAKWPKNRWREGWPLMK